MKVVAVVKEPGCLSFGIFAYPLQRITVKEDYQVVKASAER